MKDRSLSALIQNAKDLIETDRLIVKKVVEGNFDELPALISVFRDKKIQVLKGLSQLAVVEEIDDASRKLIARVQRKFPTESVIDNMTRSPEENPSYYELTDEEAYDLGSDLLYSWISHYEYVRDIFKVNTLVLRTKIPPELRLYILEARNCFAFQQYNAVISLCRTILEGAAKDICEKNGYFEPHGVNVIPINPEVFNQLISAISKGSLKKRSVRIYYRDACPVVHGDKSVNADEALCVLRDTTGVVQELYSLHGF